MWQGFGTAARAASKVRDGFASTIESFALSPEACAERLGEQEARGERPRTERPITARGRPTEPAPKEIDHSPEPEPTPAKTPAPLPKEPSEKDRISSVRTWVDKEQDRERDGDEERIAREDDYRAGRILVDGIRYLSGCSLFCSYLVLYLALAFGTLCLPRRLAFCAPGGRQLIEVEGQTNDL